LYLIHDGQNVLMKAIRAQCHEMAHFVVGSTNTPCGLQSGDVYRGGVEEKGIARCRGEDRFHLMYGQPKADDIESDGTSRSGQPKPSINVINLFVIDGLKTGGRIRFDLGTMSQKRAALDSRCESPIFFRLIPSTFSNECAKGRP
jgi:hypothetical protein